MGMETDCHHSMNVRLYQEFHNPKMFKMCWEMQLSPKALLLRFRVRVIIDGQPRDPKVSASRCSEQGGGNLNYCANPPSGAAPRLSRDLFSFGSLPLVRRPYGVSVPSSSNDSTTFFRGVHRNISLDSLNFMSLYSISNVVEVMCSEHLELPCTLLETMQHQLCYFPMLILLLFY